MAAGVHAFKTFAMQLAGKLGVPMPDAEEATAARIALNTTAPVVPPAVDVWPTPETAEAIAASEPVKLERGPQQSHSEYDPSQDGSAAAPAVPADIDVAEARRLVKALIKELIDNVAMGSAMPADGKHRQHLSRWLVWWRTGAARKSLQLDCAGLSLAVYCLARLLSEAAPALARVSLVVRCAHTPKQMRLRPSTMPTLGANMACSLAHARH